MKKNIKMLTVLSTAALMTMGMSAITFAGTWDQSTGSWRYLDNNGTAVTDKWEKSGDGYFYLGSDGNLATDQIIEDGDDYYYVNESGERATNAWHMVENDDSDTDAEYRWMYFGSDGKAYRSKDNKVTASTIKTIDGKKYAFDSDGHMLYGWVDADSATIVNTESESEDWKNESVKYYFGGWNDGAMVTGWRELTVYNSTPDNSNDGADDYTYWFYFDANGKKQTDKKKTINGKSYLFAADGHMKSSFASKATDSDLTATSTNVSFLGANEDGSMRKNHWVWAVPSEELDADDHDSDEYSWWYADKSGNLVKNDRKKINGRYYLFDSIGRMQSGLVDTTNDGKTFVSKGVNKDTDYTDLSAEEFKELGLDGVYFYSNDEEHDGSRKTGYQNVEFDDGTYQMYFNTSNGHAETGYITKINKFTASGLILKADTDTANMAGVVVGAGSYKDYDTYEGLLYDADIVREYQNKDIYLVNTAGSLLKKKTNAKDNNDYYFFTDKDGKVIYASSQQLKKDSKGTIWIDSNDNGVEDSGEKWSVKD